MLHMLRSGITLYFDPKGDKSKDIALHYPLRNNPIRQVSGAGMASR